MMQYEFIGTHATGPIAPYGAPSLQMQVDASTRSINYAWRGCDGGAGCAQPSTGSLSGLISFTDNGQQILNTQWGSGTVALTFAPDGSVNGSIYQAGDMSILDLSFGTSAGTWNALIGNSICYFPGGPPSQQCEVGGYVTAFDPPAPDTAAPVPEPGSIAMFAVGLIGLGGLTWRRRSGAETAE
jgi:hypothetical protein